MLSSFELRNYQCYQRCLGNWSVAIISLRRIVDQVPLTSCWASGSPFWIAFIALDFSGYWGQPNQSWMYNIFWNKSHLSCTAARSSIWPATLRQASPFIWRIFTVFCYRQPFLEFTNWGLIAVVGPIHLFAQFLVSIPNTFKADGLARNTSLWPAHHRVHPCVNPIYLDKNMGKSLFFFLDKLFGTLSRRG